MELIFLLVIVIVIIKVTQRGNNRLLSMQDSMNRLFSNMFAPSAEDGTLVASPAIDMKESENELSVWVTLPGVDPKNVELSVNENVLSVRASIEEEVEKGETKSVFHLRENTFTSYYREIRLPFEVDADKAEADYKNGILTITLPKAEIVKPKSIQIRTK